MGYAIELTKYALLHLGRGLVRKGYGKYVTVIVGLINEHADEVYS
jgi:hypothetical protein